MPQDLERAVEHPDIFEDLAGHLLTSSTPSNIGSSPASKPTDLVVPHPYGPVGAWGL